MTTTPTPLPERPDSLVLLDRVAALAAAEIPNLASMEVIIGWSVDMYVRTKSLFDGLVVLLRANLPEEAMILARSIFEESLRLQQLAADTAEVRRARVLGWLNQALGADWQQIRAASRAGLLREEERSDLEGKNLRDGSRYRCYRRTTRSSASVCSRRRSHSLNVSGALTTTSTSSRVTT